jgi:hypothetical protein
MAYVTGRWAHFHDEHPKICLSCIFLSFAAAAGVALFGYVMFVCHSVERDQALAPIKSLADFFRH